MPENVTIAFSHYLGVAGTASGLNDGMLFLASKTRLAEVADGTSNTLFVGDSPTQSR